ncbi:MAG: Fur family transcriptional regulator [Thermoguttaceae bacterium]|jgi:Fur family ferric uptake transcriptional regulator
MPGEFSLRSVQAGAPPVQRFTEFLASRGKRITRQRRLIVETVFSHHDHFDADELMAHLQESIAGRELSRPTIYRTLAELVESGLLKKMALSGRSVFEHDYGYPCHDHLYCQACNALIEFHSDDLERIRDSVAGQYDFQVLGHRMFVTGVCADCRARRDGVS